jgi:cell division protein FtsB
VGVPLFVLSIAFKVFSGIEDTAKIKAESEQLREQIQWQTAENEGYEAILTQDDQATFEAYVLRTARERLGLSLPGDKVYVDSAASKTTG